MPAITPRKSYDAAYYLALVSYLESQTGLDWDRGGAVPAYGDDPAGDVVIRNIQAPQDLSGSIHQTQAILLLQWVTDIGEAGKVTMLDWLYEIQEQVRAASLSGTYNSLVISQAFEGAKQIGPPEFTQISNASRPELALSTGTVLYQFTLTYQFLVPGVYQGL
jgi:hypothetical protein